MKLRIITKEQNDPNNQIYINAVGYFLKHLLGDKNYDHVERVDIKMQAVMKDDGECFTRQLKNKKITVRIKVRKDMSFIRTLTTLAHECVHVSQFITGKLKITKNNTWYWGTNNYGWNPYFGMELDDIYKYLPWEKEAIYKENDLVKEFIDYYLDSNS